MRRLEVGTRLSAVACLLFAASAPAEEADRISNWTAAPYWAGHEAGAPSETTAGRDAAQATGRTAGGRQALGGGPLALPFIALPPCRLVDTRGNGAPLQGGFLPAATVRNYTLTGVCGVPANAQAISLNATAVNPTGPGFLVLYPQGGTFPPVSTLNFLGNDVIVNAAVVPLSGTGGIAVALGVSGGDVLLDTNGYYAAVPAVHSLNAQTGDLTLVQGTNVTITPGVGTLTIAAPGAGGTVKSVGTGAGLTGGPIFSTGTVSVAPGGITSSMIASGAVGLAQINTAQVQARGASTCPAESSIQTINPDGSVVCAANLSPLAGFSRSTLDSMGIVGSYSSMTIGSDGLGLISYWDYTNFNLKVAHCSNAACTAATLSTLDSAGVVGSHTSITIGSDGLGVISYFDLNNGNLKVAHCSNAACTAATLSTLDSAGYVGQSTSITIGSDGLGLISYFDGTNQDLKVAHCSNTACTAADPFTLDSVGNVGPYTSITIGSDGLGLISYYDSTNQDLKVAHCSNTTCSSATLFTLDSAGSVGEYTSITIGSDGLGLITYLDRTNLDLKVAHCSNTACSSATLSTLDSAGSVGEYGSITIGSDGLGLITYLDGTNGNLKVAHCSNTVCTAATTSTLDNAAANTSITVGPDGLGLITYFDGTNEDLKVAHCSNALCTPFVRRR